MQSLVLSPCTPDCQLCQLMQFGIGLKAFQKQDAESSCAWGVTIINNLAIYYMDDMIEFCLYRVLPSTIDWRCFDDYGQQPARRSHEPANWSIALS